MRIELIGLEDIPIVDNSSDISQIIKDAIIGQGCGLEHGDIILIAETLISKAEDNFIVLDDLTPSDEAIVLAEKSKKEGISMNQYCVYLLARNDALQAYGRE